MVISLNEGCIKLKLPNGKVVDILSNIFDEMQIWLQNTEYDSESGGFIVGYKHSQTDNVTLENISHPYPLDIRNRFFFSLKDYRHELFLMKSRIMKSFYMGVWHTHPQKIPIPSLIDWNDWKETLKMDITACEYAFFIITGTEGARVWVGEFRTKQIMEIYECEKEGDLYKKI